MKRVLLVNSNTLTAPYPVPPLGLCLVAGALESRYEVRVFDGTFQEPGAVAAAAEAFAPDYVGLGLRNVDDLTLVGSTLFLDDVARDFIRPLRAATAAPLILGGSGYSLMPAPLLQRLDGDYGVVGPGEQSMPALLAALDAGAGVDELRAIPGVLVRGAGEPGAGPLTMERLGGAGAGDVHRWLDFAPYRQRGSYPLQTRRGCVHRCVYCTYPLLEGRRLRPREPADIADEIQRAHDELGAGVTFEFVDSTFNTPPGHAEAVCQEIVARGLPGLRLRTMGVNPAGASRELFRQMKAAGFTQIDITPDSASPRMLRNLGKGFSLQDLERAAAGIAAEALPAMWFFLLGGPGEDEQTLAETLDFIDRHVLPDDAVYMGAGLRIYPGTPLQRTALAERVLAEDDDLVEPRFYVSAALGDEGLIAWVKEACASRPNCLPAWETRPDPGLMQRALRERQERGLDEPMFRTLIRLSRVTS